MRNMVYDTQRRVWVYDAHDPEETLRRYARARVGLLAATGVVISAALAGVGWLAFDAGHRVAEDRAVRALVHLVSHSL